MYTGYEGPGEGGWLEGVQRIYDNVSRERVIPFLPMIQVLGQLDYKKAREKCDKFGHSFMWHGNFQELAFLCLSFRGILILVFWDRVLLCTPSRLELSILLPLPPKCWDYRHEPPIPCLCLGLIKHGQLCSNITGQKGYDLVEKDWGGDPTRTFGSKSSQPLSFSVAGISSWDMGHWGSLAGSNILLCWHRLSRLMSKGWALRTKGSPLIYPCK
jgi:hypothetical protein